MTVGELRELLVRFDPNLRVVTAGFDDTYIADIREPEIVKVVFDVRSNNGHLGPHEESENGVEAVLIDHD